MFVDGEYVGEDEADEEEQLKKMQNVQREKEENRVLSVKRRNACEVCWATDAKTMGEMTMVAKIEDKDHRKFGRLIRNAEWR